MLVCWDGDMDCFFGCEARLSDSPGGRGLGLLVLRWTSIAGFGGYDMGSWDGR